LNVTLIGVWFGLHMFVGDRVGLIGILDTLAMYLFVPLLLLVPFLLYRRSVRLWTAWTGCAVLFVWLWHGLFLPDGNQRADAAPLLRVMTYNVLGFQDDYEASIANIRDARADVVLLQEVNLEFAELIRSRLATEFPFQVLDPKPGVNGMGTISRYPIKPTGETLGLVWVGRPQLLALDWAGTEVVLVNFHTLPPRLSWERYMKENFRIRNEQARALSAFAESQMGSAPVVCAGDLNAVDISTAYRTMRTHLNDAWLDGAVGPGHTFPNAPTPPRLLFRIDYIFYSSKLATRRAFLARNEGKSDHRGIVADLAIAIGAPGSPTH